MSKSTNGSKSSVPSEAVALTFVADAENPVSGLREVYTGVDDFLAHLEKMAFAARVKHEKGGDKDDVIELRLLDYSLVRKHGSEDQPQALSFEVYGWFGANVKKEGWKAVPIGELFTPEGKARAHKQMDDELRAAEEAAEDAAKQLAAMRHRAAVITGRRPEPKAKK